MHHCVIQTPVTRAWRVQGVSTPHTFQVLQAACVACLVPLEWCWCTVSQRIPCETRFRSRMPETCQHTNGFWSSVGMCLICTCVKENTQLLQEGEVPRVHQERGQDSVSGGGGSTTSTRGCQCWKHFVACKATFWVGAPRRRMCSCPPPCRNPPDPPQSATSPPRQEPPSPDPPP